MIFPSKTKHFDTRYLCSKSLEIKMNEQDARQNLGLHGYNAGEIIGQGGYAMIFRVQSQKYNQDFVAKIMFLDARNGETRKIAFQTEVAALVALVHPNIVKIYDSYVDGSYYVQILEYCPNGSLSMKLKQVSHFTAKEIAHYMLPIIDALIYIHSNNISHSDIKPSNILLDAYNRPILADFGLAQKICSDSDMVHFKGSRAYMAPEFFSRAPYDPFKADVWALGVSIFELSAGKLPWNPRNPDNMIKMIRSGIVQFSTYMDKITVATIKKILIVNPKARPTAAELLELPLFKVEMDPRANLAVANNRPRRMKRIVGSQSRMSLSTLSLISDEQSGGKRRGIKSTSSAFFTGKLFSPSLTFQESKIANENGEKDTG